MHKVMNGVGVSSGGGATNPMHDQMPQVGKKARVMVFYAFRMQSYGFYPWRNEDFELKVRLIITPGSTSRS